MTIESWEIEAKIAEVITALDASAYSAQLGGAAAPQWNECTQVLTPDEGDTGLLHLSFNAYIPQTNTGRMFGDGVADASSTLMVDFYFMLRELEQTIDVRESRKAAADVYRAIHALNMVGCWGVFKLQSIRVVTVQGADGQIANQFIGQTMEFTVTHGIQVRS